MNFKRFQIVVFFLGFTGCLDYNFSQKEPIEPGGNDSGSDIDTDSQTPDLDEECNGIDDDGNGIVEAQRIVAKRSAALLAESIFPIRVVDIYDDEIYLNYGDSILSVGDRLKVIQEGREIIDQDTGLSLGSRQKTLGEIEIVSTDANLSIAKITKEDGDFTIGSVAKMILSDPNSRNKKQRERKGRKI